MAAARVAAAVDDRPEPAPMPVTVDFRESPPTTEPALPHEVSSAR